VRWVCLCVRGGRGCLLVRVGDGEHSMAPTNARARVSVRMYDVVCPSPEPVPCPVVHGLRVARVPLLALAHLTHTIARGRRVGVCAQAGRPRLHKSRHAARAERPCVAGPIGSSRVDVELEAPPRDTSRSGRSPPEAARRRDGRD